MVTFTQERDEHGPAIERLLDAAFGEARPHKTSQRLRDGRVPLRELSLVALDGQELVGTVRLWPVLAGRRQRRALLLGPLAVDARLRDHGVGGALIREAVERAREAGEAAIILVGDAPYYARFGFCPDHTTGLWLPGPVDRRRFLAREIKPGSLAGAKGPVLPLAA
ncbi:MAG TPA: N-acetyltransferase [Alphaproteobacteria bacterium]